MGLPAVKHESRAPRTPRLTVVRSSARKAPKRSPRVSREIAQRNFRLFGLCVAIVSALGMGRVWLSVQAVEASMDANKLRDSIKTERYEGDMLEVRQSALGSPSRIQAIAGRALGMAPASKVTYLDLTKADKRPKKVAVQATPAPAVAKASVGSGSGFDSAIARVMDLTAGEAQVLLVGDVGLASSR